MHSVNESKTLLERALTHMPADDALAGVRATIRKALNEINAYDKKRQKRVEAKLNAAQQWEKTLKEAPLYRTSVADAKKQLEEIEKMIAVEELKLAQNVKVDKPTADQTFID